MIEDNLSLEGVCQRLSTATPLSVSMRDTVTSTSTLLREAAQAGAAANTVLMATQQTAGRGRLGRKFFSPANSGLYLSLLLRPQCGAEVAVRLTAATAVAVCVAIEQCTGLAPRIKWVNDVLLGGLKVCGILTEASSGPQGRLDYVVIGLGVNVYAPAEGFPPELRDSATSLLDEKRPGLLNELAAAILTELTARCYDPASPVLLAEYRQRGPRTGQRLTVETMGRSQPATVCRVEDDFRLRVRYTDGTEAMLDSGEVRLLPPYI